MSPNIFLKASILFITFIHKLTEYMYNNNLQCMSLVPNGTLCTDEFFDRNTGYRKGIENLLGIGQLKDGRRVGMLEYRGMHHLLNTHIGRIENTKISVGSDISHTLILESDIGETKVECHELSYITLVDEPESAPVLIYEMSNADHRDVSDTLSNLKKEWFFNSNDKDTKTN